MGLVYKVMLAFNSEKLLKEIQTLNIWGDKSEFEIIKVVRDGKSAYEEMKKQKYDLVIIEISVTGLDVVQLLRRSKSEGLCEHFVLCSEKPDFEYARSGIILGAFDYLTAPFDINRFYSMFSRIKNEVYANGAYSVLYADELISYFENRDNDVYEYIDDMLTKIYKSNDLVTADRTVQQIFKTVVDDIFDNNDWLDLYISQDDLFNLDENCTYRKNCHDKLCLLYDEFSALYPKTHNDKINEVILYILYNPESDLKQKTIADNLYINSSYLSTVFSAHTDMRFVDYLTVVKMKRAAWLLRNTNLKIIEIASRLYYKDMGYFIRLFKNQYSLTPSEYRIPESYTFDI